MTVIPHAYTQYWLKEELPIRNELFQMPSFYLQPFLSMLRIQWLKGIEDDPISLKTPPLCSTSLHRQSKTKKKQNSILKFIWFMHAS